MVRERVQNGPETDRFRRSVPGPEQLGQLQITLALPPALPLARWLAPLRRVLAHSLFKTEHQHFACC